MVKSVIVANEYREALYLQHERKVVFVVESFVGEREKERERRVLITTK